jgi:hypothetical protein
MDEAMKEYERLQYTVLRTSAKDGYGTRTACVSASVYVSAFVYIYMCIYVCVYMCMCMYVCVFVCVCILGMCACRFVSV